MFLGSRWDIYYTNILIKSFRVRTIESQEQRVAGRTSEFNRIAFSNFSLMDFHAALQDAYLHNV